MTTPKDAEQRCFPIEAVLGLTTGVLLKRNGFSELHELAEFIAGHSIWTHEFADKTTVAELREAAFRQHPSLRDAERFEPEGQVMNEYLPAFVARAVAQFGPELSIERGSTGRTESPIASLARIKGTI